MLKYRKGLKFWLFAFQESLMHFKMMIRKLKRSAWMLHVCALTVNLCFGTDSFIDGTNDKHLELYSIIAEHDNTGFPLSYCLLSTATSLELKKRTKALISWASKLWEVYGLNPSFIHIDKDMAEIG